ncbi:neprilysin-1-like [Ornithodoros turicata]|uniref:neprilysin-1-like n=1 Tax=Ornithodoros turicata TaxID=34597 RepID=UPI00313A00B6
MSVEELSGAEQQEETGGQTPGRNAARGSNKEVFFGIACFGAAAAVLGLAAFVLANRGPPRDVDDSDDSIVTIKKFPSGNRPTPVWDDEDTSSQERTKCRSDDCQYMRWLINLSVDKSLDPCDNFYSYVCSGANRRFEADFDRVGGGMLSVMAGNITTAIYWSLKNERVGSSSQSGFQKAAALLQHCEDARNMYDYNVQQIPEFLRKYQLALTDQLNFLPLDIFVKFLLTLDIPLLFSFQPALDGNTIAILMDQHPVFVESKNQQTQSSDIDNVIRELFSAGTNYVNDIITAESQVVSLSNYQTSQDYYELQLSHLGSTQSDTTLSQTWTTLLQTYSNSNLPGQKKVRIRNDDINFFIGVFGKNSQVSTRALRAYFAWRTTLYLYNTLNKAATPNECLQTVLQVFPNAASSRAMLRSVTPKKIGEVEDMTKNLVAEIDASFARSAWLDSATRSGARTKLSLLGKRIGFLMGFESDAGVNRQLQAMPDLRGPFIVDFINAKSAQTNTLWSNVYAGSLESIRWSQLQLPIYSGNAAYFAQFNTIFIPAGILYRPAFAGGGPPEINYGALGAVLTHELMHGYDIYGRQHDGYGQVTGWFTDASKRSYSALVRCHNVNIDNAPKARRSDEQLNEYLADSMGRTSLFNAYRRATETSVATLGNVKGLTSDQIFFVSWCLLWCGKTIADGVHPPAEDRCNLPYMNSVHFSQAFRCRRNAPMNPSHKCSFW